MPWRMTHVHANITCRDTTSGRRATVEKKKDRLLCATNCVVSNSTVSPRLILGVGPSCLHMCLRCPRASQLNYSCPSREPWIFHRSCDKPASLCRYLRHLRTSHMAPDLAWEHLLNPSSPDNQHNPPLGRHLHWLSRMSLLTPVTVCTQEEIHLLNHRYPMPSEMF